jgi:hypothetical protein
MSVQTLSTRTSLWRRLVAGGPFGNELLTQVVGAVLLVLLAVEGLTIIFLRQLIWLHLFIGVLLVGPVLLKLASTGYRFVHYYASTPRYRRKGPPPLVLRLTAPLLVATTAAVLASGVVLLLAGPSVRSSVLPIHRITFFVWLGAFAVHLLGHLPTLPQAIRVDFGTGSPPQGVAGRRLALAIALLAALFLAILVLPDFPAWQHYRHAHH